jgi:RecJ-like exonuclease
VIEITYCDNCGEVIPEGHGCFFSSITVPVASANVGESASLCEACFGSLGVTTCGSCTEMLEPDWTGGVCPECRAVLNADGSVDEEAEPPGDNPWDSAYAGEPYSGRRNL